MGDPRVFFAAERTLLAWVRTGLTVMAFGFLVARFGLFLRLVTLQLGAEAHAPRLAPLSNVIGIVLVLAGSASILFATREHRAFLRTLPAADRPAGRDGGLHEGLATLLGILGILLTVYLVLQARSPRRGFYDQWMYHPLMAFDSRCFPLAMLLRPGNAHDGWKTVPVLRRVIHRLRQAFPAAAILLRADSGFTVPELYEFCEAEKIPYVIGLVTNPRLVKRAEPLMKKARSRHEASGQKVQLFAQFRYRADSWPRTRRVVYKGEVMDRGDNPRFVVTTLPEEPEALYRINALRGRSEDRIKDPKDAVLADRLSPPHPAQGCPPETTIQRPTSRR